MNFGKISFDPVEHLIGADMGDMTSRKIQIHHTIDNRTCIGGGFLNIVVIVLVGSSKKASISAAPSKLGWLSFSILRQVFKLSDSH